MATIISFSLPAALRATLDREARRQRRSRSWIITEAIRRYVESAAAFQQGQDVTLLEGLALEPSARAQAAEDLWDEAWPFAPATTPFARVLASEADVAVWKRAPESLRLVRPQRRRVREGAEPPLRTRVAHVCRLLNAAGVRYVLIGGAAGVLHGVVRATRDVDVLIDPALGNVTRALEALAALPFGVARELDPEHVARAPVTIVGDSPRVDLITVAWSVRFADAAARVERVRVEDVDVPLADLDTLIRSKRTGRLQDQADIETLERLRELRGGTGP